MPKEGENGEASSSSSDDESDDDDAKQFRKEKKASKGVIGPALQSLGFYAASIKPGKGDGWLFAERAAAPANPLINIEESALLALVGKHSTGVVARTKDALMRVYPKVRSRRSPLFVHSRLTSPPLAPRPPPPARACASSRTTSTRSRPGGTAPRSSPSTSRRLTARSSSTRPCLPAAAAGCSSPTTCCRARRTGARRSRGASRSALASRSAGSAAVRLRPRNAVRLLSVDR